MEENRHQKRRRKYREFLNDYKLERGCELCGFCGHPAALQFDHINPEEKSFMLNRAHDYPWDKVFDEIKKCRVLCANCHSIHTYNQNGRYYSNSEE